MSADEGSRGTAIAASLREAFDGGFSRPPRSETDDLEPFLLIRVATASYAVSLADVSGIVSDRVVVPIPTTAPGFLGIMGMRGAIFPVWSLNVLLGFGPTTAPQRWMLLVGVDGTTDSVALAFEALENHVRVARANISEAATADANRGARLYVRRSVSSDASRRAVLDLGALTNDIRHGLRPRDAT